MTTPPPPPHPADGGGAASGQANPYAPPAAGGAPLPPVPPPVGPPPQAMTHPQFPGGFPPYPPPASAAPTRPDSPLLYPGAPVTLEQAIVAGRPVKAARWGIGDFFIAFGLWIMFSAVAVGLAAVLFGDPEATTGPGIMLAITMPWIGLAGWPLLVAWWRGNGPVIDFGLTARISDLGWGLLYGLAALVAAVVIAAATTAIFGEFDSAAGELADSLDGLVLLILFAIAVGIGAPIAEELAFRGLLFGSLGKRGLAPWLTIGISAAVFSMIHFEPIRLPLLLSTGIILGLARYHRGSTTVAIIAHMVNNIPAAIGLVFLGA